MALTAILTKHARERLALRTRLTPEDFGNLLDGYRTISVGYEPDTYRWHRLFFSAPDMRHYVAIQDISNGVVITILPIDYHENLAWKISAKRLRRAVALVSTRLEDQLYPTPAHDSFPGIRAGIAGHFWKTTQTTEIHNLGRYRFKTTPEDADDVLQDDAFIATLIVRVRQKKLSIKLLDELWLTNNKKDFFIKLAWMNLVDFNLKGNDAAQPSPSPYSSPAAGSESGEA